MSCKINLQNGNEIPCWIKPSNILVFSICLCIKTYIMLLRNVAAPTKICNINKSVNQEQGWVPDDKISYLFCFSTVRLTLLEVKIQPCLFYTMWATVSEQLLCLGHQNTQNFRQTHQLLSCTDCIFPRRTPTPLQGFEPGGRSHIKTTSTQLLFWAKQTTAASKLGPSRQWLFPGVSQFS